MLIIEGSDNLGKTTAARKIAAMMAEHFREPQRADRYYKHMTKPPDDFDHAREYMERVGPHAQDRFHLGALTYGRLTNNGNCPSSRVMRIVQRYLRWHGCVVVVMHAERDWLRRAQYAKEEMYRLDTILDVNDAFRALTRTTNGGEPYCDLDYDVSKRGFPGEEALREWFEAWRSRWNG